MKYLNWFSSVVLTYLSLLTHQTYGLPQMYDLIQLPLLSVLKLFEIFRLKQLFVTLDWQSSREKVQVLTNMYMKMTQFLDTRYNNKLFMDKTLTFEVSNLWFSSMLTWLWSAFLISSAQHPSVWQFVGVTLSAFWSLT